MRNLPEMKFNIEKKQNEIVRIRNINYSDNFVVGDFAYSRNISSRRFPYIATRNSRVPVVDIVAEVCDVFVHNYTFVVVKGITQDTLYYIKEDNTIQSLGSIGRNDNRQFVPVNTKIVVFPDGKYIDISGTPTLKDLNWSTEYNFAYICEAGNRLWACTSDGTQVWASHLGDPTQFEPTSTDVGGWATAVGTPEKFTGCCKYMSSVLFFKENSMTKVLGDYPSNYQSYTYQMDGVKEGCYRSIVNINESLFYYGIHGVMTYGGGNPNLISQNFGDLELTEVSGGSDGEILYLSGKDNNNEHLFTFDFRNGVWIHEDDVFVKSFARDGKYIYGVLEGDLLNMNSGMVEGGTDWEIQFKPFFESISGAYQSSRQIIGHKAYQKVILRVEVPEGSELKIWVRADEGEWKLIGRQLGKKKDIITFRLPQTRCDKYELKLNGTGAITILDILREHSFTSEV